MWLEKKTILFLMHNYYTKLKTLKIFLANCHQLPSISETGVEWEDNSIWTELARFSSDQSASSASPFRFRLLDQSTSTYTYMETRVCKYIPVRLIFFVKNLQLSFPSYCTRFWVTNHTQSAKLLSECCKSCVLCMYNMNMTNVIWRIWASRVLHTVM